MPRHDGQSGRDKDEMMSHLEATAAQLPLVDEVLQGEWQADVSAEDVRAIVTTACQCAYDILAQIEVAAATGDCGALKRQAHKLKGMSANLGAQRLAARLREIERAAVQEACVPSVIDGLSGLVRDTVAALNSHLESTAA